MNSRPLAQLDRRHRRREVISTVITLGLAWALLIGIYYLVPFTDRTSAQSVVRLVIGIAAFVLVLIWQLHGIRRADFPIQRAASS